MSEHFPRIAAQTHRLAIVRSMTHDDPAHLSTAHRLLTGHLAPTPTRTRPDLRPGLASPWGPRAALPSYASRVSISGDYALDGGLIPPHREGSTGQHGGWLGKAYEPFRIEGDPNGPDFAVAGLGLPEGVAPDRLRTPRVAHGGREKRWGPAARERGGSLGPIKPERSMPSLCRGSHTAFQIGAKIPRSAITTAGTSTVSACSWPGGWSRPGSGS